MPKLFLGLDSSTQSLSSVLIDLDSGKILDDRSINFDSALPDYRTQNGVLRDKDPTVVHSPPLMWADALDLLFQQLKKDKLPLGEILAVSGSGQQHGSVYMTSNAEKQFRDMDLNGLLADNLGRVLSRPASPIWMDSSTGEECGEIREAMGGMANVVAATGSDCFERFTGPQIRKFSKQEPGAYRQTGHIALVSSLMSSLMAGQISPIDVGDGAGMNLMDISKFTWHPEALTATAPELRSKLPPIAPSNTILGVANPYFVLKYGLNPACKAVVWSGDNPCSLIGTGLVEPGMIAISLGTSDTLFGAMAQCETDPRGEGHVFGSPAGGYMSLICFKNGSLAREKVKDAYGYDWNEFSRALQDTPVGNQGKMMLPWFDPEIVPRVIKPGVKRENLDPNDADANCRAVVEAQMMSMRLHSAWMGKKPACIYATGGASTNAEILRIMADVHNTPVYRQETANGAALGAALRAAQAYTKGDWKETVAPFTQPLAGSKVDPNPEAAAIYNQLIEKFEAFERANLS
ncbi:MAG: carbohydrate kinase [Kiritimatiellae bacterium]|nr:carbohydrate kinase [Kiritimatiellia bacterium]